MRDRTQRLLILFALAAAQFACAWPAVRSVSAAFEPQRRRARQTRKRTPARAPARAVDYTKFSHATAQHRKACDSCHKNPTDNWKDVRAADAAFPDITDRQ